jgi:hypothetical protein
MSISINNPGVRTPATQLPVRDGGRTRAPQQPLRSPIPAKPEQAPKTAVGAPSVPVEPPPGTDPALWSVLSGEERAFFAKVGAMGPLTYGRMVQETKAAQLPASRGGRLDVRI